MRLVFESLPILAAMFAIVFAGRRALITKDTPTRITSILGIICAAIMIAAQTSWAWTLSKDGLLGTDFANMLWTVFNLLVMLTIIYAALKAAK